MRIWIVLCFILLPLQSLAAGTSEKAVLQAAMQQHLDRQLIDGAVLDLDLETGEIKRLFPTKAHPMILTMGENYVLCATLNDLDGNEYLADYYMAPNDGEFVVIRTEIDNRDMLKKLMQAGTVKRLK